jgi:hypothetical protein
MQDYHHLHFFNYYATPSNFLRLVFYILKVFNELHHIPVLVENIWLIN